VKVAVDGDRFGMEFDPDGCGRLLAGKQAVRGFAVVSSGRIVESLAPATTPLVLIVIEELTGLAGFSSLREDLCHNESSRGLMFGRTASFLASGSHQSKGVSLSSHLGHSVKPS
jgi:hypothetical protein